ncbi:helicase associated domain-containing protein [Streptomyces sp. GLT-R25]
MPWNVSVSSGTPGSRPSTAAWPTPPPTPPGHGHLAVPVDEVNDGYPLGRWLATQRTRAGRLTAERTAALTALDPWWNPPWPFTWQRAYHDARRNLEGAGTAKAEEWLDAQRTRADDLHPGQLGLITQLGCDRAREPGTATQRSRQPARERAFQRGLAAARAYLEREGHLNVPQRHIETLEGDPVRLGQWLSNVRRRQFRSQPTAAGGPCRARPVSGRQANTGSRMSRIFDSLFV